MKIVTVGRGNVGGGLAGLWRQAGHDVTTLGRDGGDTAEADVVVVAVPALSISEALGKVRGLDGKVAIDATNALPSRNEAFPSLAHEVKAFTGGPVAKSFNLNFAALFDQIASQRVRPSNMYCGDDGALEVTRQLNIDAGYDPVLLGGLDQARAMEEAAWLSVAAGGGSPVFYRYAPPGEL